MTTNAVGNDEWIGVDDMSVTGTANPNDEAPTVQSTTPSDGDSNVGVGASVAVNFSEPVTVTDGWYTIACSSSGAHTATVTGGPVGFTIDPDTNFANSESCTVTVVASHVTDQDTTDPPDAMAGDHSFSFTTAGAAPLVVISQVYGGGGNAGATLKNDFIELFNRGASPVSLNGWSVQYASAAGTGWTPTNLTDVTLQPGHYYLVQEAPGAGGSVDLPAPDRERLDRHGRRSREGRAGDHHQRPQRQLPVERLDRRPRRLRRRQLLRRRRGGSDTDEHHRRAACGRRLRGHRQQRRRLRRRLTDAPRNTLAPTHVCNGPTGVGAANPPPLPPGDSTLLTVAVTPGTSPTSTGLAVSCDLGSIGGASGADVLRRRLERRRDGRRQHLLVRDLGHSRHEPGRENAPVHGLGRRGARQPRLDHAHRRGSGDADPHDPGRCAHLPLLGQTVSTHGIVTASTTNGFWMQDATPDADPATSEGIFVFTSSAPRPASASRSASPPPCRSSGPAAPPAGT